MRHIYVLQLGGYSTLSPNSADICSVRIPRSKSVVYKDLLDNIGQSLILWPYIATFSSLHMAEDQRSALLRASKPPSKDLFCTLITANHILHYHNVVDAYGHISVRNPQDPTTFFISKSLAPALVSCREDLEEYRISDASPVNEDAPKGYAERFIHSEIYKKYKGVHSVVHGHPEVVLPFSISSIPLRPV